MVFVYPQLRVSRTRLAVFITVQLDHVQIIFLTSRSSPLPQTRQFNLSKRQRSCACSRDEYVAGAYRLVTIHITYGHNDVIVGK